MIGHDSPKVVFYVLFSAIAPAHYTLFLKTCYVV